MERLTFVSILKKKIDDNREKYIKFLITTMFFASPIIDILRATYVKNIEIFNISIIEALYLILIVLPFLLTIPKIKFKHQKYLVLYFIIVLVFIVFHVINTYKFDISILSTSECNAIIEVYYIFRLYILPLLLMIVLFENRDIFNRKYYLNIMKYLVMFISGQIVLLNLFRYSYGTYSDNYMINRTTFLDVFTYSNNFKTLLTVGLFPSANQIALVLLMILPLNIYNLYLKTNFNSVFLVILQILSMIVIGTKVAAFGSILVLITTIISYFFFVIIKIERCNYNYLLGHVICLIVGILVISISPFIKTYMNEYGFDNIQNDLPNNYINEVVNKINYNLSEDELIEILYDNPSVFKISPTFYELYPIANDKDFWIGIALRDRRLNNDYRLLKNDIMRRIKQRNNNKLDTYLGMGYTIGIIDMERDYIYQYYLFGIIGLFLFVGLYIFFYFSNILKIFKKNYFNYNYCICLLSPFLGLVACYFSGHLFGWVTPMIVLTFSLCFGRVNS